MNPSCRRHPRAASSGSAGGHPWIYRADVGRRARGGRRHRRASANARGRLLGHALYSDRSQIALRMLTHRRAARPTPRSFAERIDAGDRDFASRSASTRTAYRLVHGEGDLLPSLVVDRYGDYLVVQTLSQGMDRLLPVDCRRCSNELAAAARHPRAQRSARAAARGPRAAGRRALRARCRRRSTSSRAASSTTSISGTGRRPGSFSTSAKTGRPRRLYAHGRLLDCFSYNGGFALTLAPRCSGDDRDSTSRRTPSRACGRTPSGTASRWTRASATSSTSCAASSGRRAVRHDRARSARVREEQGRGREGRGRLQGNQPARAEAARTRRHPRDVQLLLQRQRRRRSPTSCTTRRWTRRRT